MGVRGSVHHSVRLQEARRACWRGLSCLISQGTDLTSGEVIFADLWPRKASRAGGESRHLVFAMVLLMLVLVDLSAECFVNRALSMRLCG